MGDVDKATQTLNAANKDEPFHRLPVHSRRDLFLSTAAAAALGMTPVLPARADAPSSVVVAGATGQTGRRVLEKLAAKGSLNVIAGVRDVDTSAVTLAGLDVEMES